MFNTLNVKYLKKYFFWESILLVLPSIMSLMYTYVLVPNTLYGRGYTIQ